jgi:boron transporter
MASLHSQGQGTNSQVPVPQDPESQHIPGKPPRTRHEAWWKIHLFRGMANDLRQRAPYYLGDWTDAWDYRVVPATIYMYFAKYVNHLLCSQSIEKSANTRLS